MPLMYLCSMQVLTSQYSMQAELGAPLPDAPDCGGVQITVECSPCAGAAYQVGQHSAAHPLNIKHYLGT